MFRAHAHVVDVVDTVNIATQEDGLRGRSWTSLTPPARVNITAFPPGPIRALCEDHTRDERFPGRSQLAGVPQADPLAGTAGRRSACHTGAGGCPPGLALLRCGCADRDDAALGVRDERAGSRRVERRHRRVAAQAVVCAASASPSATAKLTLQRRRTTVRRGAACRDDDGRVATDRSRLLVCQGVGLTVSWAAASPAAARSALVSCRLP